MSSSAWQLAKLLPRFYEKNALSICGKASHFKITTFKFGHDPKYVNESKSPPELVAFDENENTISNIFYTGTLDPNTDVVWSNGRVLFRCEMPKGGVSSPSKFSLTGLFDNDGDLVAVSVDLPDWVTPDESLDVHPYIQFPIA
ncbi:conserved hypothetical protein [Vibrio nigripulchritudo SOn1]|uniref:Uncharacterized protein n=1 Tax=Vibrio nigripulchritudo SOn1 TaxID=1238450 RepID=A0AAV2VQ16_9VIBR|nr:hypothetical protein [Vibrio nigripulchritudo]CCO46642.1 conserved hypothetical protein [Vibrio nigripulchritudo SOn1]